jgi:uncharacterized protein
LIEYILPLNIHRAVANSNVEADRNKVAIERGPIVYCLEGVDNHNMSKNLILPDDALLSADFEKNKLNGVVVITGSKRMRNVRMVLLVLFFFLQGIYLMLFNADKFTRY